MSQRNIPDWCKYFDRIFLINLRSRKDRLRDSLSELRKYDIPFMRVEAIQDNDGALGLYLTMMHLFEKMINANVKNILVFEDDVKFLEDPAPVMNNVVKHLNSDYDLLYLGCNLPEPVIGNLYHDIIPIERALSTHAVSYSRNAMETLIHTPMMLPFDVMLANGIQTNGKCYATLPMIATQRFSFSNIENRLTDYHMFLEDRFKENTKHLL